MHISKLHTTNKIISAVKGEVKGQYPSSLLQSLSCARLSSIPCTMWAVISRDVMEITKDEKTTTLKSSAALRKRTKQLPPCRCAGQAVGAGTMSPVLASTEAFKVLSV